MGEKAGETARHGPTRTQVRIARNRYKRYLSAPYMDDAQRMASSSWAPSNSLK
jgi:hypothetical protein